MKFLIGLFIDIVDSLILGSGTILITLLAMVYVIFYIPDMSKSIKR